MVPTWIAIIAMVAMFIGGRRSVKNKTIHIINHTKYGINSFVSKDNRVIVIESVEEEK